jgi:hypothetical protein
MLRAIALSLGVLALGCHGPEYVYEPARNATAELRGHAATRSPIPPESPRGDVRVASFGIAKVTPPGRGDRESFHALHARMVVQNNDRQPWIVDTREQRILVANLGPRTPAYAKSDIGGMPLVRIEPATRATLDLFYPLPRNLESAAKIPEFDVEWRVHTPVRTVTERTPFARLRAEPLYAGAGYWGYPYFGPFDWGPFFWYDPLNSPVVVMPSRPVILGQPSWLR